jgi:hypothetical protein
MEKRISNVSEEVLQEVMENEMALAELDTVDIEGSISKGVLKEE